MNTPSARIESELPSLPQRPRGRPKLEDTGALEAQLVQAAQELFFSRGYGDTTMSAVASVARVSKRTLYARFSSKAELFQELVTRQMDSRDSGDGMSKCKNQKTLEEALVLLCDIMLAAALSPDFIQLNRLIFGESGRFPELGLIAARRYERGVRLISQLITVFSERDQIECRDPHGAAELLSASLMGWWAGFVVTHRPISNQQADAWVRKMVKAFLAGRERW